MSNYQKSRKIGLQYRNGTTLFTTSLVANGALATNYNLTLPAVLPTVGPQALVSDTAGNLNWTTALNATTTTSFAGANNVTTATNVTGLTMVSTSYATTTLYVLITGTVNQSAIYTLTAILTPTGTYNFTYYAQGDDTGIVFTMNPVTGQVLYTSPLIAGFVSLAFSWLTPKTITNFLAASTTSVFNAAAPQTVVAPVTGLVVNVPSLTLTLYVLVNATTNLTQVVTLTIYTKGTANNYALAQTNVGDDTGILFLIGTATGQVQYTSPSFVGWTSTSIQWTNPATLTTTPTTLGSLALTGALQVTNAGITVGSLNSIVSTSSLSTTTGSSLTLASQTVQDTATAANGTLTNFQSVYLGIPTLSAANTSVTTTTASTLTIAGPPVAGTNETIANTYALNIQSGNVLINSTLNARVFGAIVPPTFIPLSPSSPWVNFGGSYEPLSYAKVAGIVYVKGLLSLNNGGSATAVIATLPVGFRPLFIKIFTVITYTNNRAATCVEVSASGVITPNTASGFTTTNGGAGYLSMEFSFIAEQ